MLTCLIPLSMVHAQQLDPEQLKDLPPEVATQLQQVPLNQLLSGRATLRPGSQPAVSERDADWVNPLPITLHLKGRAGKPLPDRQAILRFNRVPPRSPQAEAEAARKIGQQISQYAAQAGKLSPLPECSRDTSSFKKFQPEAKGADVKQDLLFIRKEDIPLDAEEAFGKKTIVVPYEANKPSNWSVYGKRMGIKCLPTRTRILARGMSVAEGLPALKNYDSDPYGNGQLSDAVKSRSQRLFSDQEG